MKDAFLFLLLAAVAYLVYDDYSKRDALKQAQDQIQQMSLNYQRHSSVQYVPRLQSRPTTPSWFQRHLDQGSSLEQSKPHFHQDEQGAATPFPSPH